MFYRVVVVLILAATVTGCGGGEDDEEPAVEAFELPMDLPSRGPEWLVAPTEMETAAET